MALSDFDTSVANDSAGYSNSQLPVSRVGISALFPRAGGFGSGYPLGTATGNSAPGIGLPQMSNGMINLATLFPSSSAPAPTPTQLFASQKNPALQGQIDAATATHANNQNANEQSLTDFVKGLIASKPKVEQYGQQEQQAVSNIYDPNGLEKQLAGYRQQKQNAVNLAAVAASGAAQRANNVARLQNGNSSYLDRVNSQNLMNIAVNAAGQNADQAHADAQYITDQRNQSVGRRQQIIDSILGRNLAPVAPRQQIEASGLSSLGQISDLNNANNLYQSPEDAYSRRLSFLQSLGYQIPFAQRNAPQYLPSSIYRPIAY